MLKIPISCSENIIITTPAIILRACEFCKKILPKKEAVAPNIINTNENPKENNINGIKLIFFFLINHLMNFLK